MMQIKTRITEWVKDTLDSDAFQLVHPKDIKNGDFSLIINNSYAEQVFENLNKNKIDEIDKIEFISPRFINIYLSPKFFANSVEEILNKKDEYGKNNLLSGEKTIIEYTVCNVLKPMHIGHLMGNVIGESLSRIIESSGAKVKRNNYQGDSGLHIAKAVWGIVKLGGEIGGGLREKTEYIGRAYALGANTYDDDINVQEEIKVLNKKIFEKSDQSLNDVYEWGRRVSLDHFEELYKKLGTKFDYYFFESEVTESALKIVHEFLDKGVFEESDGAIVFKGEKFDPKLHTRVFINSQGLPMYEAKDIAHAERKYREYKFDKSIIVTSNEQTEYFKVVLCALDQIDHNIAEKTKHIAHGTLKLPEGKMSSRKGNVITGESLIEDVEELVHEKIKDPTSLKATTGRGSEFSVEERDEIAEIVAIGAIKYSILRQAVGGDIIFDFDKSISFEGDSGPYLQYAHTRARSVLEKALSSKLQALSSTPEGWEITELEKYLYRFPEVVERAREDISPHHLVTYLTELAGIFNSFYANEQIIVEGDNSTPYKLVLTEATATVLKNGLYLLGIRVPERM